MLGKLVGEVLLVCCFFGGDPPKKYVLFVLRVRFLNRWWKNNIALGGRVGVLHFATNV